MLRLLPLITVFGSLHTLGGLLSAQVGAPGCPVIQVTGPAGITRPRELFSFTGSVDGKTPENVTYEWTATGGRIKEGQGTQKISVDADWREEGTSVSATLNVRGLPDGCPRSASGAVAVDIHLTPKLIDEFGRLTNKAVRMRLKKFFTELSNNPNNQGYIIVYGTESEMTAREQSIANSVRWRNFDRSRITIVRAGTHESGKVYTKLYRIPPGTEYPAP